MLMDVTKWTCIILDFRCLFMYRNMYLKWLHCISGNGANRQIESIKCSNGQMKIVRLLHQTNTI